jgi:hypothetical protein
MKAGGRERGWRKTPTKKDSERRQRSIELAVKHESRAHTRAIISQ